MAINAVLRRVMRITDPPLEITLPYPICYSDENADGFAVAVLNEQGSSPASLTGLTVTGIFLNANGADVNITDAAHAGITDGVVWLLLPPLCYNVIGPFTLTVKLVKSADSVVRTLMIVRGRVMRDAGTTHLVPADTLPNIPALIAQLQAEASAAVTQVQNVIDTIPQDYTALSGTVDTINYAIFDGRAITSDDLPSFGYAIANTNKWREAESGPTVASVIAIPKSVKRIDLYAEKAGVIAFLADNTATIGETPDFATNYGERIATSAGQHLSYAVTGDMNYLYVLTVNSSSVDVTPEITFAYYTDETLTIPGMAADAKAVHDALDHFHFDSAIGADGLPSFGYSITGTNKWREAETGPTIASVIVIPKSAQKVDIKANANQNAVIAFLSGNNAVIGETPDFSTGFSGRIVLSASQSATYAIAGNMNFLYVLIADSKGNNMTPEITFTKALEPEINKIDAVVSDMALCSEMILYTDFEQLPGCYDNAGNIAHAGESGYVHSQLLRIKQTEKYYFGWKNTDETVTGAFFDINKNWIAPLLTSNLQPVTYKYPTGRPNSDLTHYVQIYAFTAPQGAYYLAINTSYAADKYYCTYVSNKPVFALTGTGNYYVRGDDPIYQKYKNRKLCVIGPSTVSIDRAYHTGNNMGDGTTTTQHLVGWQEYLIPWWQTVDSYGYSSASWRKYDKSDGASEDSIYTYVVGKQLDIADYDDYILLTSSNGGFAAANIGTITSAVDLGDVTKYMGGLRQTIEYIYSLNPNAIIYVQTVRYQSANFGTSATEREQIMHVNDEIRNMCHLCSFRLLDSAYDSGFNQHNSTMYSYDGGSHYNHIGSKIMGLSFRKAILGF